MNNIRNFLIFVAFHKGDYIVLDILDRIIELLGDRDQKELTEYLGLKNVAFSEWKSGKSKSFRKYLIEIAEFFNVSLDYLVFGKKQPNVGNITEDERNLLKYYKELNDLDKGSVLGKAEGLAEAARRQKALAAAPIKKAKPKAVKLPEPEQTDELKDENETEYEEEYFEIPLAELPASAGTGIYLDSDQTETIKVAANEKTRQTDFAVKVSGDSMEPRYYSGDIVLVRDEPVNVGEIGIFVYEGEGYIKKLGDGCLISLNPKYPNIQIENPDSLFCQGRVISVLRLVKKRR